MKTKTKTKKTIAKPLRAVITKITAPTAESLKRAGHFLQQCGRKLKDRSPSEVICHVDADSPFALRCTIQ